MWMFERRSIHRGGLVLILMVSSYSTVSAREDAEEGRAAEDESIRRELEELRAMDAEKTARIEALEKKLESLEVQAQGESAHPGRSEGERTEEEPVAPHASPLDQALAELETDEESDASPLDAALDEVASEAAAPTDLWSYRLGAMNLRFIDLSVDLLVAAGSSTERDESIENLQGGGHDPRQRGFTLQNLELNFLGAVDPYFNMEVDLVYFIDAEGESRFELEEAFLTTQQLPFHLEEQGFQLEVGQSFTEFGRINPVHPHAWDWLDQPVVNSRFFGEDGIRGLGFRLAWLMPLPWFSELHLGMQNSAGETMLSFRASDEAFEERPIGGRPFTDREVRSLEDFLYLARLDNSWDLTDEVTIKLGASGLIGAGATGSDAITYIYGGDFLLKWRPLTSDRGYPFVTWQTEIMRRDYEADRFFDEGDPLDPADDVFFPSDTLHDWGLYSQVLYGFVRNWAVGFRYEYAGGTGRSGGDFNGRAEDPFRDNRHRLSPLIVWQATEFSRIRLQYNYDEADHLADNDAHSVWVGFEVLVGQHAAHTF